MSTPTDRASKLRWYVFLGMACAAVFVGVLKLAGVDKPPRQAAAISVPDGGKTAGPDRAIATVANAPTADEKKLPEPVALEELARDSDADVKSEAEALQTLVAEEAAQ